MFLQEGGTPAEISLATGVSTRQIGRIKKNLRTFATATAPHSLNKGRPRVLNNPMVDDLIGYLNERPLQYLDEMAWWLRDQWNVEVSVQTISRCLKARRWSYKKVSCVFNILWISLTNLMFCRLLVKQPNETK